MRTLLARFPYRLDTNFAKMDRIVHPAIEDFKTRVTAAHVNGMTLSEWTIILTSDKNDEIERALRANLAI